ncbi:MAG: hypothetical protein OXH00_04025 [Candidatus Poribacteria bacterium]|nr:hypothetical protein [Candidatus Poribacteria bacterium]
MFLRKYWLPLSVFIVAICAVGLYLLATQPPKEPIVIYKPVEPIEKPTEQPTAEVPEGDTSQGGHFHADGTWHAEPHEAEVPPVPESDAADAGELKPRPGSFLEKYLSQFSPAEAKRAMSAWFEQAGVPPPPRGYEYIWDDAWVVKRDENGQPVINKIGEPYIQVFTITAFAPNPEQTRRYLELKAQRLRTTDPNKLEQIRTKMYRIQDEAQGPYPLITASASGKKARSKVAQRTKEAHEKALVELGLGHLVGNDIGGQVPRPRPLPLED